MSQTTTTAPSINEINAALLAQVKTAQNAKGTDAAASSGVGSFASTLSAVEKAELPPPTPLVGAKTAVAAPAATGNGATSTAASDETVAIADGDKQVTKEEVLQEEAALCDAPKISRSARMECAEKATKVAESDLAFDDVLDFINPLQHIPIIGSIYRAVTGDTIKPEVQVAGSIAFGLATGSVLASAATGIASALYEENTGTEPTVQIADALFGGGSVNLPDPVTEKKVVLADAGTVDPSRTVASSKATTASHAAATATATAPTGKAATLSQKTTASVAGRTDLSTQALAQTGGLRMGNTIYTSSLMRNAGKVAAANKTVSATTVSSSASKQAVAATTAATASGETASTKTESTASAQTSLGSMMQEQASARTSGQSLPPELVHDMMLMALDKYKMAATVGSSQTDLSVQ